MTRQSSLLFLQALLLSTALLHLANSQFTAPGAYYVYAPGYNFNPGVGKRSAPPPPIAEVNGTTTSTTISPNGSNSTFISSNRS